VMTLRIFSYQGVIIKLLTAYQQIVIFESPFEPHGTVPGFVKSS
jgi:hypothetical protein